MTLASATLGGWVSTSPVAVTTDNQSGTLTAPVGATYDFGKITNSTPWTVTVLGLLGSQTLQPYTYDLVPVMPPNGIIYTVANPPGGPSSSPVGQPCYLQADWWTGSATPPGSYPGPLTAQAIAAAIAGSIVAEYSETLLETVPGGTSATPSFELPSGTNALIVVTPAETIFDCTASGLTSEGVYQSFPLSKDGRLVIPVDPSLDTEMLVQFGVAPSDTWYVLATGAPYVSVVGDIADQYQNTPFGGFLQVVGGQNPSDNVQPLSLDLDNNLLVAGPTSAGSPPSANPILVAGSDGTNARTLATDTEGRVLLGAVPGLLTALVDATLAASGTSSIVAAAAGKTITVYRFAGSIAGTATAGQYVVRIQSATTGVVVEAARISVAQASAVGIASSSAPIGGGWIPGGFALPTGEGIEAFADSGNSASVSVAGVLYYTQA